MKTENALKALLKMTSPKGQNTMTAGLSQSQFVSGGEINLHGLKATITHTDMSITTVQFTNKVRRTFDTPSLDSFLSLNVFPVGTRLTRSQLLDEVAIIEAITPDNQYHVRVETGGQEPIGKTFKFADFVAWFATDLIGAPPRFAEETPAPASKSPESVVVIETPVAEAKTAEPTDATLKQQIAELKAENDHLRLSLEHAIDEVAVQQRKAEALMYPAPQSQAVHTIIQALSNPTQIREADAELSDHLNSGWGIEELSQFHIAGDAAISYSRMVTMTRAEAAPMSLPVQHFPRNAPVTRPPGRALTHNYPRQTPVREQGATRPVQVPPGDPVIQKAFEAGSRVYEERLAEGVKTIHNASSNFPRSNPQQ